MTSGMKASGDQLHPRWILFIFGYCLLFAYINKLFWYRFCCEI